MAIVDTPETDATRTSRYQQAAQLLRAWSADRSDYDERVGEALDRELVSGVMLCQDDDDSAA